MKCVNCGAKMPIISSAEDEKYSYDLYECSFCMIICKHHQVINKSTELIWIFKDNTINTIKGK